jgi:hypothetical protein
LLAEDLVKRGVPWYRQSISVLRMIGDAAAQHASSSATPKSAGILVHPPPGGTRHTAAVKHGGLANDTHRRAADELHLVGRSAAGVSGKALHPSLNLDGCAAPVFDLVYGTCLTLLT